MKVFKLMSRACKRIKKIFPRIGRTLQDLVDDLWSKALDR